MQKPITLKMIASELGLSVSAVSKALNNYHDIGEETRKMVVDKAISLGYKWSLALYHCVFAPSVLERKTCREL